MSRFIFNMRIALEALAHNRVRSFLTALGIIFGVASVIAMMAIVQGSRKEILDQLKLVGVNNIIIEQKTEDKKAVETDSKDASSQEKQASLGLSLEDGESIQKIIPQVERISPEVFFDVFAIYHGKGIHARLNGVSKEFFPVYNIGIQSGRNFNDWQMSRAMPVCIISPEVKARFFHQDNVIGKLIKCGRTWFEVIGVTESRNVSKEAKTNLSLSDNNLDIYAPVSTVLLRYNNRAGITKERLDGGNSSNNDDDAPAEKPKYNQLDKLVVQVSDSRYLEPVAEITQRVLQRRHNGATDFKVVIPELLLKQQQSAKDTLNILLGVIAAISLLVGGIGIMNIMLVSVTERLREIGIRMALGARKRDITMQFLAEAVLISISGGIIGVTLGITAAKGFSHFLHIQTIITFLSIFIAFLFAILIGLIFGIAPARRAALQDPVESLRYE
jgi:putative ABC transport system permease protein